MKLIQQDELRHLLAGIRGATFATLVTKTNARLRKTGNPFGDVSKISRVNVTLGFQYEAAVNRQRVREGAEADFEAMPRQWGERIPGTVLVTHKGKCYLETKVERTFDTKYFTAEGKELSADDVRPFLPPKGESRQECEKEIIVRDYALDSIWSLVMKGETYMVLPNPAAVGIEA